MLSKIFSASLMFFVALCVLSLLAIATAPASVISGYVKFGEPYRFYQEREYFGCITQLMATESHLYLLFDDKQVLECYDSDGNYLCSYGVYMQEKGKAKLGHCADSRIYLKDHRGNLYLFDGIEYLGFLDRRTDSAEIHQVEASAGERNDHFFAVRKASVYRQTQAGDWIEIIHRPILLVLFHPLVDIILMLTLILIAMLAEVVHKAKI